MLAYLPRRAVASAAVAILFAAAVPHPAQADEAAAWQAWQAKRYASAQTLYAEIGGYAGQMGAGAAAWRQADYAAAARHFGAALLLAVNDSQRADALYNLGNAHYGQGHYRIAIEAYETVLRMRPADAKARTNLGWAMQRQRRQPVEMPMKSDLRGRRGMLAEGQVPLDVDPGWRREDTESEAAGMQVERGKTGEEDARAVSQAGTRGEIVVDSRLAPSGLKKMERLQDRPQAMLRNLLKQDARGTAGERPAW
jgi:Ca-activated chloride channel family protein